MKEIEITGCVVYDTHRKAYSFKDWLTRDSFNKQGVLTDGLHYHYILVSEGATITFQVPEDFDPVKAQLDGLDAQEKELNLQFTLAIGRINTERQKLLAIENGDEK